MWQNKLLRNFLFLFLIVGGTIIHWGGAALVETFQTDQKTIKKDKHVSIYQTTRPLVVNYPLVGVGRGATGIVWPRYATTKGVSKGQVTPTYIESQLVQPLVDWGILFGSFFVIMSLWLLLQMYRRSVGVLEQSCWVALCALVLQNAVDFNLEFVGTTFPFLVVLAALDSLQRKRLGLGTPKLWPAALAIGLGIGGIVALVWLAPFALKHNITKFNVTWQQVRLAPASQFRPKLKTLIQHHAADFTLPLRVAAHLLRQKNPPFKEVLQWLERAEFLNPTSAAVHIIYAEVYAELGLKEQAVLSINKALLRETRLKRRALEIAKRYRLLARMLRKTTSLHLVHIALPAWSRTKPTNKQSDVILDLLSRRFPKDYVVRLFVLQRLYAVYAKARRAKDKSVRAKQIKLMANIAHCKEKVRDCEGLGYLYEGHIASHERRDKRALALYRKARQVGKYQRWQSLLAEIQLLRARKRYRGALSTISLARTQINSPAALAALYGMEGQIYLVLGRLPKAKLAFEEAVTLGDKDAHWLALAKVCWARDETRRALRILRRLIKKKHRKPFARLLRKWEAQLKERRKRQLIAPMPVSP